MNMVVARKRIAFTLIEILISVTLISIVTLLALPKVREALKSSMMTSAANTVDGAMELARSMAITSGKPHGILIERNRDFVFPNAPSGGTTRLNLSTAQITSCNYSNRITYVQVPADYDIGEELIAFFTLSDVNNNCSKRLRFFAPQSEAPLLYAAADTTAPGHLAASRLVGIGSQISISLNVGAIDSRISTITNLELVGPGGVADTFGDYVNTFMGGTNAGTCIPLALPPVPQRPLAGVIVTTADFSIQDDIFGDAARSGIDTVFGSVSDYQSLACQIQLRPTKAAVPPVKMPGKSVIDLSMSGSRIQGDAFGVQGIVGTTGTTVLNSTSNPLHGVIVMFATDGSLDSIHLDRLDPATGMFVWERFPAPQNVCLLVGTSESTLSNADDAARYPTFLAGTNYARYTGPPGTTLPLLTPAPPSSIEPVRPPNFANPDHTWVVVNATSGYGQKYRVAEQLDAAHFTGAFGLSASTPRTERQVLQFRLETSRRLAFSGAR